MSNNALYMIVTVIFMVGLAVIGILISRGIKDTEDWMVASKSLGKLPMAGTYFATIISATSIMSYMGYYYLNGWSGWWNAAGTLLTSFLACMFFARRMRQSECNTLPELIEKRYSGKYSIVMSLLIVVSCTALLGAPGNRCNYHFTDFLQLEHINMLCYFTCSVCRIHMYRWYESGCMDRYDLLLRNHHWYLADRNPVPVKGWRIHSYERKYCGSESGICKRIQC